MQDELRQKIKEIVTDEEVAKQVLMTRELMTCYRCAIMEVETKFRVLDEKFSLHGERNPIESIKSRVKSPESIAEKLRRKGLAMTPEIVERAQRRRRSQGDMLVRRRHLHPCRLADGAG